MPAKHCRIYGQVQGVGYRQSLQQAASRLGLTGWVRNRRDGSVEAVIYGEEIAVTQLITWAKKGPAMAKVTQVLVSDTTQPEQQDFVILPTE